MTDIRLIAAPYELGRLRDGVGLGPEALLEGGAERALAQHGARVRGFYAAICVVTFFFCRRLVPETKGKHLEEITEYFEQRVESHQRPST